ncbi:uncharacterized protein LOC117483736 [Trematomus bernacchii]|uniref:uncharacterized protein LOC117483736 n=1 Tax=Trematomus bernacchii TaxID=40690 RepID=UPI00146B050D|nr:uncharacterized protein LOC117483736 [Trematomus bernacchii]
MGMAPEREHLEGLGLSQDVVRTIQGARAASTRASYTAKWTAFQRWCLGKSLDPITCPLPHVLSFLQLLLDRLSTQSRSEEEATSHLLCPVRALSCYTIYAECHRITNLNLKNHFYAELDRHAPRLQSLFRKKAASKGKVAEVLNQLFVSYDLQEQGDVHVRRAAVLRALPAYLHEDDSTFLRLWHVEQSDDPDIEDIAVGLLMISARSTDTTLFCPERIAVVIEGNRVIKLPTLADAFILLFALPLSYPKDSELMRTLMRTCPYSLPTLVTHAAVSKAIPASFFVTWTHTQRERDFKCECINTRRL